MKVVLDCNVVVAAARTDGACREAIDRVMRDHELVLSAPILSEYETVAARPAQVSCRETLEVVIREIRVWRSRSSRRTSHSACATPTTRFIWRPPRTAARS